MEKYIFRYFWVLKLSQQCVQECFYTADISTFSIGGQFDTFCMVVSVDPKTVIWLVIVIYVFCFGSHTESKWRVCERDGERGGVFLFLYAYDCVTYHSVGKREVKPWQLLL